MKSRYIGLLLAVCSGVLTAASPAMAADYPTRPVKMVVPFAAGGSTDLLARTIGHAMEKAGGQAFVIENVGGAGATIGTARVADAPPDGYTILLGSSSALVIAPHLHKVRYDPRTSFEPIGKVATASFILMTRPGSGMDQFEQFVAKAKADPGKMNYGSPGTGSALHLTIELMLDQLGLKATHVPFNGSAPVYTSLIGGNLDFMVDSPSGAVPMVNSGRLVALAVTTRTREKSLPQVPTLQELGLRDFESMAWFAMMAPKGTPQPVVQWLRQRLAQALKQPDVHAAMLAAGFNPVQAPETLVGDLSRDYDRWGVVITKGGIEIDK
ncbi:tripartite tricarboxylate transporter substrate binding protein [Variovorax humicola]|uniref:Tripartite tricarboxylate transporter substrate binding protein n=1 Tax=Variovorax humicola TaxID=1769758 RepID=A0ABU8W3B6_9BURK